jgi:hypothetical protein
MGRLRQQLGLQHLETDGLSDQEEVAEFDAEAICPPEGDLTTAIDKDRIFADALRARPELLPPDNSDKR